MKKKMVMHNGREVIEGWPEKIEEAQKQTTLLIEGERHDRVRYGEENPPWDSSIPCHDCAVIKGQLHVPGCDVERCPVCKGQAITCLCHIEFS